MTAHHATALRVFVFCLLALVPVTESAGQSLAELIDQHLQPVSGLTPETCSDAEFLRRVSLDLTGMPPTVEEARAFLADESVDKRARLVEQCLKSPQFERHMASVLDVMLMERRKNTHVPQEQWEAWLLESVRNDKPWNLLAREILLADGEDENQRPAARFALDRGPEPNLMTHDISRIFFGRDMQCAQCHDHPLIGDYLQSDYHGLLAYVTPSYAVVRKEKDKQTTLQAERAGGELTFESVFDPGNKHRTGPRIPDGVALAEPFFMPGEEYVVAPAANVKSVPKFSRRTKLAELATDGSNQAFNQNIVNRLWAHMFGRGLVHPLDLHHSDNPAADPELLQLLGERFAATNYDIRGFLREVANSGVYQRSFDLPPNLLEAATQAAEAVAKLEQQREALEQTADTSSSAYSEGLNNWAQAEATMLPVAEKLDAARKGFVDAKKKTDAANKALADVQRQQQAKQTAATALEEAAAAAQLAAEQFPEDGDLNTATQQLAAKTQQLQAELPAINKAVEEKSAAAKPLAEAFTAAGPLIEAAHTEVEPLKSALLEAEQAMFTARKKSAADNERLSAIDERLATARKLNELHELNLAVTAAAEEVEQQRAQLSATEDPTAACTIGEALAAAESTLAEKNAALDACINELSERLSSDFTVASLRPLSPEQLCWSVLRATGVYDQQWQAATAELDKASPLSEEQQQDAAQLAARANQTEQAVFDKLKGNVGTFVRFYGAAAGQPQYDFFSTADQALFAANGGPINNWASARGDNVTQRMTKQADARLIAEELYLAVLTRMPSEEETAEVTAYLTDRTEDKAAAAQELVWSLLNSAEFRFNH